MGFNISGLVIDRNYENDISELESIIGEKLVFEKEVIFEETLESWKEDSYCDIYFSKKGSLILLSMEIGGFEFFADNQTAFSFVLSEMSMTFTINYTKNNKLVRSIMVSEDMIEDEGEPFEFETDDEDKSELIYQLIENTLGESFHEIDLEARCFRYSFKQEPQNKSQTIAVKKAWWKFW
jgi:hypothetical protein